MDCSSFAVVRPSPGGGPATDRGSGDSDDGAVYDIIFDDGSSRRGVAERWVEPLMLVRYDETHAQDVFSPRLLLAQAVPTSQPGTTRID